MAEETMDWKPLIDRMKAEGQLTRNGKNSIRAVNVNLEKLTGVMQSIGQSLIMQSSFLESAYNIQTAQYELDRERARDAERLARLNPPQEESTTPETTETDTDDEEKKKKKKDDESAGGLLKTLFSGRNFKIAALASVGIPFIYGFVKGSIDQLTGGKFTEFEKIVTDTLPDLWSKAKNIIALVYGNIKDFLETGDISELLKDEQGNPLIDMETLKEKAAQYGQVALTALTFGPLAAIGTAMGFALTNGVEELTGYDIPDGIEASVAAITGAALGTSIGRKWVTGLIGRLMTRLVFTPFGAIAAAMGLAFIAARHFMRTQHAKNEENAQSLADATEEAQRLAAEGKTQEALDVMDEALAANPEYLTTDVNRLAGISDETAAAARSNIAETFYQSLMSGELDPQQRRRAMGRITEALKDPAIELEDRQRYFAALLNNLSTEEKERAGLDGDMSEFSERDFYQRAFSALTTLGLTGPSVGTVADQMVPLMQQMVAQQQFDRTEGIIFDPQVEPREVVGDTWAEENLGLFTRMAKERQAEWDATYGQFYNNDGTLKLNILENLTDALKQQAIGAGLAFNAGGNTFVGGTQKTDNVTQYNFTGGAVPAQSLHNGPHQ